MVRAMEPCSRSVWADDWRGGFAVRLRRVNRVGFQFLFAHKRVLEWGEVWPFAAVGVSGAASCRGVVTLG